ncbi:protein FAR1-RELATED SEQUENCE 5-like [Panicum miliaceum]|uniref:Protein FAR1-RELATED SEQUENCE 5-like n=1 Tax=Panicum miliaceum TaxID=4540 RepID=A0A3L6T5E0_PANMI|nr:protein FAR1-RELATED SEQUENCE 5-like [Panicum miliaceum]
MGNCSNEQNDVTDVENDTGCEPCDSPPVPKEIPISESAPKEATTKGRKRGGKQVVNDDASTSKAEGKRTCGYCGSLGHYSTGCDINPENAGKKRGSSESLRGKMGRKRGRPPTKRQLEEDFDAVASDVCVGRAK